MAIQWILCIYKDSWSGIQGLVHPFTKISDYTTFNTNLYV